MLKSLEGNMEAAAVSRLAVKFVVDEDAKRSWPAGGSVEATS